MSQQPPPLDPLPMRAESLPFGAPYEERRRPGILTAVGVISIVLASFGLLAAAGEMMQTFLMGTVMSRVSRTFTTTSSFTVTNGGGDTVTIAGAAIDESLAGMSATNRAMVIAEFNKRKALPQPRQEMAEKLLADVGEDALPFSQSNYTPERIAGSISESGKLPSADDQKEGNHYFILANGRIEIADDHAVFMPSARGAQTVRVYRNQANSAAAAATMPTTLPFTMPSYSTRSLSLAYTSGMLNLIAAAFLLFLGIMVLRDARRGRALHLIYALLKLLLVGLAVYASWSWYSDQTKALSALSGPMPSYLIMLQSTMWNIPASLYPIALLIVMNTPPVRTYYRTWANSKLS